VIQSFDLNFAGPGRGTDTVTSSKISALGHADKSGFQTDFTRRDHGREPPVGVSSSPMVEQP